MVKKYHLIGYENFCDFMKKFDSNGKSTHIYFCGSKLENGESWCDDCVRAWPIIEKELEKSDPDSHFIYVEVGDRATWKDPKCPFRTDPKTKLLVLPTIKRWNDHQLLTGDQCEKPDLVSMLLTEED